MRSARIRKRLARSRPPMRVERTGLPDPFSRFFPLLVAREEARDEEYECPCCQDRWYQMQLDDENSDAIDAAMAYFDRRDELEYRYSDKWPLCGSGFCFCTDCCEASEHAGPDYDEWRRAFPALAWDA